MEIGSMVLITLVYFAGRYTDHIFGYISNMCTGLYHLMKENIFDLTGPVTFKSSTSPSTNQATDKYIYRLAVGTDATLTYDGQITRFISPVLNFSVEKYKVITTASIDLLEPGHASVENGSLYIQGSQFYVVIDFSGGSISDSYNKDKDKNKEIRQISVHDTPRTLSSYKRDPNKIYGYRGGSLYHVVRFNSSNDESVRNTARSELSEYSNTYPDYSSLYNRYLRACIDNKTELKRLQHESELQLLFGLSAPVAPTSTTALPSAPPLSDDDNRGSSGHDNDIADNGILSGQRNDDLLPPPYDEAIAELHWESPYTAMFCL